MKRIQPIGTLLILFMIGIGLGFKGRPIGFWLALASLLALGLIGYVYRVQKNWKEAREAKEREEARAALPNDENGSSPG